MLWALTGKKKKKITHMEGLFQDFVGAIEHWRYKKSLRSDYQEWREIFEAKHGQTIDPKTRELYLNYLQQSETAGQGSILMYPAWKVINDDPEHKSRHLLDPLSLANQGDSPPELI